MPCFFLSMRRRPPRATLFPYRRSSDLVPVLGADPFVGRAMLQAARRTDAHVLVARRLLVHATLRDTVVEQPACDEHVRDRKSTRLNSSHTVISYAVFCLKKKKKD